MSKNQSQRVAVIYYPGRVDRRKLAAAVDLTVLPLGWEPTLWLRTSAKETGGIQVHRALAQKATHIVVAGGDGTVRQVLEAVAISAAKVSVGIVPVGTGNVLARNLNLELVDLNVQVRRAILGNGHPIDLGLARIIFDSGDRAEKYFAVMAGIGLDAKIMMNTDAELKRRLGWVAYIEGGLKALPVKFERLKIRVDNKDERTLKVVSLLIGNAGWLPGNLSLMPEASLDDGRLDAAAIGPRRFWNWIDFWSRVTVGNHMVRTNRIAKQLLDSTANVKTLENLAGKKIRVVPENAIDIQLDGDAMGKILEVEIEVQPRAVNIRS